MKMEPVEIMLEDNKTYAQVAFLVDNPSFLSELQVLRTRYKVTQGLGFKLSALISHFVHISGGKPIKTLKNLEPKSSGFGYLIEESDRLMQYLNEHQDIDLLGADLYKKVMAKEEQFIADITAVRRKFQYPIIFDSCIIQAVLFHKVQVFKTAYATFINRPAYSSESSDDFATTRDKVLTIIATPYSTKKDILDAFRKGITNMRDITESTHPLNAVLEKDTIANIKRNRNWYWQVSKGKKYRELAVEFNIEQNSIEQAVSRYRNKLQFTPVS